MNAGLGSGQIVMAAGMDLDRDPDLQRQGGQSAEKCVLLHQCEGITRAYSYGYYKTSLFITQLL